MAFVYNLTEDEKKNAISRTMISLFHKLSNIPSTVEELHIAYSDMKGGIELRKQGPPKDKTSSVRSYISQWNRMAKELKVIHEPDDQCIHKKYHRICKRRESKKGNVYWLNKQLADKVLGDPELTKPCCRSKRAQRRRSRKNTEQDYIFEQVVKEPKVEVKSTETADLSKVSIGLYADSDRTDRFSHMDLQSLSLDDKNMTVQKKDPDNSTEFDHKMFDNLFELFDGFTSNDSDTDSDFDIISCILD